MALNDNALVTWEFAQSFLKLKEEEQTQENTEFLINSISQRIENVTGRSLKAPESNETKYLEGDESEYIILPEYPVLSITGLYLDSAREFGTDTEIAATKYNLDSGAGIITLYEDITPKGVDTIKIVLIAGYETVPADLQQAVLETIRWNMSRFSSGGVGLKTLSGDGMNMGPELTIPQSAWQVILNYRREL